MIENKERLQIPEIDKDKTCDMKLKTKHKSSKKLWAIMSSGITPGPPYPQNQGNKEREDKGRNQRQTEEWKQ